MLGLSIFPGNDSWIGYGGIEDGSLMYLDILVLDSATVSTLELNTGCA